MILIYNKKEYSLPSEISLNTENNPCCVKLRMNGHDGFVETPWMIIHKKDKEDYDRNVQDHEYTRIGLVVNTCLSGIPWGSYVPYKLGGTNLPYIEISKVIDYKVDKPHMSKDALESIKTSRQKNQK